MTREEKRELKQWLTSLLPEGLSRNDVADEFDVSRKTVSGMLNPDSVSFGNGLTMLRYLRLVGAVTEAPTESPASSRLAALEAKVDRTLLLLTEALQLQVEERGDDERVQELEAEIQQLRAGRADKPAAETP